MKAESLDHLFDSGESIVAELDLSKGRRPILEHRKINLDLPIWMIHSLDRESKRLGVTRQSVIKMWVAQKLEGIKKS